MLWEIGIHKLQWSSKLTIGKFEFLLFFFVPFEVAGFLELQIYSGSEFVNY